MALSELPLACGDDHVKAFKKFGWVVRSRRNHIVLTNPNIPNVTLSIPNHKEVKKQLLKRQIELAQLTDSLYREVFDSV
jgi:predicted RNA binding protein YcfA (HicA-like mRNA interferase family)